MKRKTKALTCLTPNFAVANDTPREPLKISKKELKRLTITIEGCDFIGFGNAILCPTCGNQQRILINRAPDGEFNFYLGFTCSCYNEEPKKA